MKFTTFRKIYYCELRDDKQKKRKEGKLKIKRRKQQMEIFPFYLKAGGKIISNSDDKTCLTHRLKFFYFIIFIFRLFGGFFFV